MVKLLVAFVLSIGMHLVVGVALLFDLQLAWPRLPLTIEVVTPAAAAPPTERRKVPSPKRPTASASPSQHTARHSHAEQSAASHSLPEVSDLRPLAPRNANLIVLLRCDELRRSPERAEVEGLLAHLPDYRTLLDGTGLSPINDFEALLIATANPRDVAATYLAARYRSNRSLGSMINKHLSADDPRVFSTPKPGFVVLGPPEPESKPEDHKSDEEQQNRPDPVRELERLSRVGDGPIVQVTIADVRALVRLADLPTPSSLALAVSAETSPGIRLRLTFADEAEATRFATEWPALVGRFRAAARFVGLGNALDDLQPRRAGATVDVTGHLAEIHVRIALAWARNFLP